MEKIKYLSGFGNEFSSEAVPGSLPSYQNSPQKAPLGLYAEQLSGSAFTMPRAQNQRSWLYRTRPSVAQGEFRPYEMTQNNFAKDEKKTSPSPQAQRWSDLPLPTKPTNFLEGLFAYCSNGSAELNEGCAIHVYAANKSMDSEYFYNADADMLFVAEQGELEIHTEFGVLNLLPLEIAVVQRGIKFKITLKTPHIRGYLCENFGAPFRLPDLGPIGANGLAHSRHFLTPVASYENAALKKNSTLVVKFAGKLWATELEGSPLNVIAWHGNYAPYKYDLKLFNTINTVSFDHPDPSIFTVLTSPSAVAGTANIDFVIFPPRWMVAENTFRPPYFHRNPMSEFMGLLTGVYDAKKEGFVPGGASLHNRMTPHGPDAETFENASKAELGPKKIENTMAFMFESRFVMTPSTWALNAPHLQKNYFACWNGLKDNFKK